MGKIFAGLLFVFLHFRINGFDLLPDFVGYLLVWQGMKSVRECTCWQTGWAAAAAVASAAMLGVSLTGIRSPGVLSTAVSFMMTALQLLVLYDIVRGVMELEEHTGSDMRAGALRKSCLFVAVCRVLSYVGAQIGSAAAIVPSVLASVGIICYLVCCFKAWKAYEVWQEEQHTSL